MVKVFVMSSFFLICFSRRSVAWPRALSVARKSVQWTPTPQQTRHFSIDYRASSLNLLTNGRVHAVMGGFSRTNFSTLTRTKVWRSKKSELQMECSFRGLPTKGDRSVLISRLMKVIDGDEYKQDEVTEPPSLDAAQVYVLRVKGHTTPNSSGVGIGLVLYDPVNNKELWSGRIYSSGDRAGFEAEYSAIIVGLDFAKTYGIQKLTVQSSNDAIVCQINGLYKVNKTALQRMLRIEKAMEESFSDFSIEEIASGENVKASEMAKKALATRKSLNIPDSWKFDDPIEAVEQDPEDPEEPMRNEPDEPALDAVIDPSRIYLLRFDGGSRGNPGIAGAGMVLYDDQGQEIWCGWKYHSESATNNVAEYFGLLNGLKSATSLGIKRLIAEGDSQLIVKQLNGQYRVKDAVLKTFYTASVDTIKDFDYFEIRHIPRAENSRADWLANLAMDSQESHGVDEAPDV